MKRHLFIAHLSSILSSQFEELREHFDSVQRLLKGEEKRISDWMDSQTARFSPEEQDQFNEWYGEDYLKFKDSFPSIQRNAVFITIYSELEDVLKFLCRALARKIGCAIQTYKWRGGILEKVKACLEQDIGIEMSRIMSLWDEVIKIRKIRNTIVHNGGWLDNREESDAELIDYITNKKPSIKLLDSKGDDFYKIQLSDSSLFEVIDTFDQFLKGLLKDMSDWVRGS